MMVLVHIDDDIYILKNIFEQHIRLWSVTRKFGSSSGEPSKKTRRKYFIEISLFQEITET